jgi:hypothetical protein
VVLVPPNKNMLNVVWKDIVIGSRMHMGAFSVYWFVLMSARSHLFSLGMESHMATKVCNA